MLCLGMAIVDTVDLHSKTQQAQDSIDSAGIPSRDLTDEEMGRLADVVVAFSQEMTGIDLYPYEQEFGWRIAYSVLIEDAEEITALFARQSGKCLAKGTPILYFDGTTHPVEDVKVGDLLMGDDSTPREVKSLSRGRERMIQVVPNSKSHASYTVNASHIMSVVSRRDGSVHDLPISVLEKYKRVDQNYLGYSRPVHFPEKDLPVSPYWFGLWLGDGSSHDVGITTGDPEVVSFLNKYASEVGMRVSVYEEKSNCNTYAITNGNKGGGNGGIVNPLRNALRDLCVLKNKHVPQVFKSNSRRNRLEIIAGLIDSDGSRSTVPGKENSGEVTFKNETLAKDTQWLLRSIGLRASLRPKPVGHTTYWRVCFYGDLSCIPTKIKRKQWKKLPQRENPLHYGFALRDVGEGDYYGFTIDKNKRFMLGDFVVTHNTETVAVIICGMLVLLPLLANSINDKRIKKFSSGLWVGIYAPAYDQSGIMWSRMRMRMYSGSAKATLLDPDIDIDLTGASENLVLPNGSFVDCKTAAPQSSIEGKTYHVIILEECQDISSQMIRSSIHPMATATAGTLVKIGTCNRKKSDFHAACRRNKRSDVKTGNTRSKYRLHFEFDYTVASKYNERYRKAVAREMDRLGFDSDDFRLKYRLHWLLERGMFVSQDILSECGIERKDETIHTFKGRGKYRKKILFTRPSNVVTYDPISDVYAAIDVGRERSTVVTIGRPFFEYPVAYGDETRFYLHVLNWLELQGDDHEAQHPQIINFLKNYLVSNLIIDATGKGDPVYSRLKTELKTIGIAVQPFIFSAQSKDVGYKVLFQELTTGRLTYPAGATASRLQKWQSFFGQMTDLEKSWRGQTMVVQKPSNDPDASDDYPDSLMMLCYLVNVGADMEVEVGVNPLIGRAARYAANMANRVTGKTRRTAYDRRRKRPGILS